MQYEKLKQLLWLFVTLNFRCIEVSHLWGWQMEKVDVLK